jgi:plastocyanin
MVTARFRAPLPAGWSETLLRAPDGRDVVPPGLDVFGSFFNASESAAGTERALTVYDNLANCGTTDTGGIYMQRKAGGTWTADGTITAPTLGSGDLADWPNCGGFGTVTRLSRDGSWALASTEPRDTLTPDGWRNLCAAWIYHRGTTGWTSTPPALLVPPNVDPATGMADAAGCPGWGYEGGISDTGDRVAMWDDRRVDVYHRSSTGWSLEQELMLPTGAGCVATGAPRRLALSGDGAVIVVSDPDCSAGRRAYIYTRSGTSWTLVQTLTGTHVAAEDVSISADGNLITVNAAVFERTPTGWQFRTGLSTPGSVHVGCPAIVLKDTRIICGSFEAVGFNASQGAVYVFGPASGGWANGSVTIARLFSPDGFASDNLTASGKLRWSMVAASADASSILAPMPPDNVAAGLYPSDVMGYEFTQEPTHPPVAVSITDSGFSPASLNVKQGQTVNWTNNGTRSHTATDSSGMRLFFSGTLAPHASYSFTFTAAGVYPYKSAATEPAPLNGTVKVPLTVSPLTGTTATSFTITWSSAAPPAGYVVDIQKRHRSCATCTWSAWASWKSGQTARTAAFMPNQGKGMYGFRARLRKTANGTSSGWSAATAITVS